MSLPSRDDCLQLDRDDPLAALRDRFLMNEELIYLNGNSLGPPPKEAPLRLKRALDEEWRRGLVGSWVAAGWIDAPARLGAKIAALIGAAADEVIVADSTTVNIFKLLTAATALRPGRSTLLTEAESFPTDGYVMQGLARLTDGRAAARLAPRDRLLDEIDQNTAALLLTHVHYKTGELWDMAAVTRAAQARGALMIWDLSHSAGALPVDLKGCNADFAVGCGYKFLNGGPGAPAYLFAAARHTARIAPALAGWMGHARPFDFADEYAPAEGVKRFLCGTPPILAMAALEAGLDVFDGLDLAALRRKSQSLGQMLVALAAPLGDAFGLRLASPADLQARGAQISFRHENAYPICRALIARGVIGDFRAPDILRFGMTPLYTRFVDIFDAAARLRAILETRAWDRPECRARLAVT